MDYEYYYYSARSRYYNACSEIDSCQSRIYDLKDQRKNTVNRINQLKADIRNMQKALDEMAQVLRSEDALNHRIAVVADKTSQAAVNFSGMVNASDVKSKNLTDVYSSEASKTKADLANILNTLRTRKERLAERLADLQNQLSSAEADLEDIDARIHTAESEQRGWEGTRRNAANDMEYYRRKM